ncbi:unnamed protein product [Urochloa humidicola]
MAAILRSAVRRTARRAFSMEGTLSVRPLHASRSTNCTQTVDASHVKKSPKPAEVDLLVKKIEDTATKKLLADYFERLAQEEKSTIMSPTLRGIVLPCFVVVSFVGLYLTGHRFGFCQAIDEEYRASSRKQV